MVTEIMRAIVGVPMNMDIEDGYGEVVEEFEFFESS